MIETAAWDRSHCDHDLVIYCGILEKLGLEHQVGQFYVRRWVCRMCREVSKKLPEEWLWMIEKIKQIMEELPPDANKQFLANLVD